MKTPNSNSIIALLSIIFVFFSLTTTAQIASVKTDKLDYPPGATVVISGSNWLAGEVISLQVIHDNEVGDNSTSTAHQPWNVEADASGNITDTWIVPLDQDELGASLKLIAIGLTSGFRANAYFTDSKPPNLDQVRNGPASAPVSPGAWENGNLGQTQSHYAEGYSVPYRISIGELIANSTHNLIIEWDTKDNGKHALDFITSYNNINDPLHLSTFGHAAEIINPTDDFSGMGAPSTYPIPTPSSPVAAKFNAVPSNLRNLTIYNGTITNAEYVTEESLTNTQAKTQLRITFTALSETVIIAWGGHIASESDWGLSEGASAINGSPYHMRIIEFDGTGGNQDRSLSASAVVIPPRINIDGPLKACPETNELTYTGKIINPNTYSATYTWNILNNTAGAKISGTASGTIAAGDSVVPSITVVPVGSDFIPGGTFNVELIVTRQGVYDYAYLNSSTSPGQNVVISNLSVNGIVTEGENNAAIDDGVQRIAEDVYILKIAKTDKANVSASGIDGFTPYTSYTWKLLDTSSAISFSSNGADGVFTVLSKINLDTLSGYRFKVTLIDNSGCIAEDTLTIIPKNSRVICGVEGPTSVCAGTTNNEYTYLDGTATLDPDFNYTWSVTGDATILNAPQVNVNSIYLSPNAGALNYSVIMTITGKNNDLLDPAPCSTSVNVITPFLIITNPSAVCSPSTIDLTAEGITSGSTLAGGALSYWEDADTTKALIDPTKVGAGTYYIKVSTTEGCVDIQPVMVTINPTPSLAITNPSAVCSPSTIDLTAEGITSGSTLAGGVLSYWEDADTTKALIDPTKVGAGTYYIKASTAEGCFDIEPVTVTINPTPSLVITNPSAVCSPTTIDLTAEGVMGGSTLAGGVLSYWEDADTTKALINPTKVGAGTYYIKASTAEGCFDIEPVTVAVNYSEASPSITIIQPTCFISTGSIRINAPLGSGLTYSINGNSYTSGTLFSGLSAGTYTITVRNLSTCISSPTTAIINQPPTGCTGGIFGTAETCSDFKNGIDMYKMNKICFTTKSNKIFNVTPGQFFYYFAFKAPSTSFCISVIQKKTNGYQYFRLQQSNQIVLWNESCTKAATGIEIRPDSGRICINNATKDEIYVLSAKYDSKSIIGSPAPGTPIASQYSFESKINGITLEGSKVTIDFTPNCSSIPQKSYSSSANEMNVAISENEVKQTVVNAYPNPYLDIINFDVTTANSGKGDLSLYDITGKKLEVIYEGYFNANNKTSIQYKGGRIKTASAIYILTIGEEKIVGKIFKGN